MSLLSSVNAGSPALPYFIPNSGDLSAPVVASASGNGLTALRIGDKNAGLVLQTSQLTPSNIATVRAGPAAGGTLLLGSSGASPNGIVLTDNLVTINDPMTFSNGVSLSVNNAISAQAGANPAAATLDTYTNRDIHGYSDKGYANSVVAIAGAGAIPNPAPLPAGLWSVMLVTPNGLGQEVAEASAVCYWDGVRWAGCGVSFAFTAGTPNAAISPVVGGATLQIAGAGVPAGNVVFRQLLAAP